MGILGNLFDFNKDGELDAFEKAAELGALMEMMESEETEDEDEDDFLDYDD